MYGLVNKAIEDLVCSRHGEDTWEEIKRKANVDIDAFLGSVVVPSGVAKVGTSGGGPGERPP